jgi:predicted transcriptional regulator
MKYTIYQLIQPDHLREIKHTGRYTETIYREVLEELDIDGVEAEHQTLEMAMSEIVSYKNKLKNLKLTILPVVQINWEGEIR